MGAVTALAGVHGMARADEKETCVSASEQAQTLRDEGRFRAAREAMLTCSRDVCPSIVRRDCEKWLTELETVQPTVVLGARDPKGNDVRGASAKLDGAPLLERLDGKPVAVDPGEHVFRYEAPGAAAVEQRVVVRVGEKARMLTVILMPQSTTTPITPVAPATAEGSEPAGSKNPVPVAAWIFAGVAGAAGASFAYFGVSGQNDVSHMRATCQPTCAQSDVDAARNKLLAADISLGVGVAALGVAAWIVIRHVTSSPPSNHSALIDVQPRAGGAVATFGATF